MEENINLSDQTPEELIAEIQKLRAEKQDHQSQANDVITDLQAKLEKSQARTDKTLPVIEFEGKQYQVNCPKFGLEEKVHTAEDLVLDESLLRKLIDKQSGVITEL